MNAITDTRLGKGDIADNILSPTEMLNLPLNSSLEDPFVQPSPLGLPLSLALHRTYSCSWLRLLLLLLAPLVALALVHVVCQVSAGGQGRARETVGREWELVGFCVRGEIVHGANEAPLRDLYERVSVSSVRRRG